MGVSSLDYVMSTAAETLAVRKQMMTEYPWIYRLKRKGRHQCAGKGGKCKQKTEWRYKHSAKGFLFYEVAHNNYKGLIRFYCWKHMRWAIESSMYEYDRVLSYAESHDYLFKPYYDKLNKIRSNGHG